MIIKIFSQKSWRCWLKIQKKTIITMLYKKTDYFYTTNVQNSDHNITYNLVQPLFQKRFFYKRYFFRFFIWPSAISTDGRCCQEIGLRSSLKHMVHIFFKTFFSALQAFTSLSLCLSLSLSFPVSLCLSLAFSLSLSLSLSHSLILSLSLSRFLSLAGQRSSNKSNDLYQKCICLKIKWSRTMKLIFLAVEKISLRSSNFCTACNDALLR
jgi:hypothetical protein